MPEIDPHHPLARAHRLYMAMSKGEAVVRRQGEHQELDLDRAVCADTAEYIAKVINGEVGHHLEGWKCFHCGELFTDKQCAEDHFSLDLELPACIQVITETEKAIVEDRRMWRTAAITERDKCENLEYTQRLDEFSLKQTFGTSDIRKAGLEHERVKDELSALKHLTAYLIRKDLDAAAFAFKKYDPQLVSPEEYLKYLEKK